MYGTVRSGAYIWMENSINFCPKCGTKAHTWKCCDTFRRCSIGCTPQRELKCPAWNWLHDHLYIMKDASEFHFI